MQDSFDGILLIDKPVGWSSFNVVAKIRSTLSRQYLEATGQKKKIKVGHTGTLDPLARGLMIVVVGSYCKRAQEFSKLDKIYEVQIKLGETSTTGDEEGEKIKGKSLKIKQDELVEVLASFVGKSMQTPPAFSAIKINGKRAYDLARAGKELKLEPRPIEIYSLELSKYDYPHVEFTVHVSSGTYIRSLAVDIGEKLGTGAYMSSLRRTQVGKYDIGGALELTDQNLSNLHQNLLS